MMEPASIEELTVGLRQASVQGQRAISVKLDALNRVLDYNPADMTVTVQAGIRLAAMQERLRQSGQWLPIDPPNPSDLTIAEILNLNLSGPRRYGHGTIREHLLGLTAALADGRLIHSGGKVVKNVAGYDLCKLFVGSRGSLGVIVEATFKVLPLPECEQILSKQCESLDTAAALLESTHESALVPTIIDLHNVALGIDREACCVVLGLAGTREDVEGQVAQAAALGLTASGSLEYEQAFWSDTEGASPHRMSVLPSQLIEALQSLGPVKFVARAGNGVIYYRGGTAPPQSEMPLALMQRIKDAYDPNAIFPSFTT